MDHRLIGVENLGGVIVMHVDVQTVVRSTATSTSIRAAYGTYGRRLPNGIIGTGSPGHCLRARGAVH